MKVYLAAPYGARDKVREYAVDIIACTPDSVEITASWLFEQHEVNTGTEGAAPALSDEQVATHARTDLAEIEQADAVVLFTAAVVGVEGGGGRHVETGYALALGKPLIVVGKPENVFHRLGRDRVRYVSSWMRALSELSLLAAGVTW